MDNIIMFLVFRISQVQSIFFFKHTLASDQLPSELILVSSTALNIELHKVLNSFMSALHCDYCKLDKIVLRYSMTF